MHKRECGECTLCCTVTMVPELKKPVNTLCDKCDNGCTIYDERPDSCKKFKCQWLRGDLNFDMRPDKIHTVIEKLPGVPVVLALVEPGFEYLMPKLKSQLAIYTRWNTSIVANNGMAIIPDGVDPDLVKKQVVSAAKSMGVIK